MLCHATSRQLLLSLWLMGTGLGSLQAAPAAADAAARRNVEIAAFELEPLQRLSPGSTLVFRLRGTPGGRASVRVPGLGRALTLQETAPGLYEGSHIVQRQERLAGNASATASLRVGRQTASARMARLIGSASAPAPAVAVPSAPAAPTTYVVSRFVVPPVNEVVPGAVLRFILEGTPGGAAAVAIDGVAERISLPEVSPGRYEGSHTVQPQDQVLIGFRAVASLQELPGKAAATRLMAPMPGASAPGVHSVVPTEGSTVAAAGAVSIAGHFGDPAGAGVDPKSVQLRVAGRDVTRDASITGSTFNYRAELRPGVYPVEVTARDVAGQPVRYGWQFTVGGSGSRPASMAAADALEFTSHLPNATVQPGRIVVSGRTVASGTVMAQVKAFLPGAAGAPEVLYNDRVRATAGGEFSFAFQPANPVHGTRYDIEIEAVDGLRKTARLSLFQQR